MGEIRFFSWKTNQPVSLCRLCSSVSLSPPSIALILGECLVRSDIVIVVAAAVVVVISFPKASN